MKTPNPGSFTHELNHMRKEVFFSFCMSFKTTLGFKDQIKSRTKYYLLKGPLYSKELHRQAGKFCNRKADPIKSQRPCDPFMVTTTESRHHSPWQGHRLCTPPLTLSWCSLLVTQKLRLEHFAGTEFCGMWSTQSPIHGFAEVKSKTCGSISYS